MDSCAERDPAVVLARREEHVAFRTTRKLSKTPPWPPPSDIFLWLGTILTVLGVLSQVSSQVYLEFLSRHVVEE